MIQTIQTNLCINDIIIWFFIRSSLPVELSSGGGGEAVTAGALAMGSEGVGTGSLGSGSTTGAAEVAGITAAEQLPEWTMPITHHGYQLAFAMTDYYCMLSYAQCSYRTMLIAQLGCGCALVCARLALFLPCRGSWLP